MAWIKAKTPGIRFREHPNRRHGIKPDKYYVVRYKIAGKDHEEKVGWASEGWTEAKAAAVLADLKRAQTLGQGAKTLAEARSIEDQKREAETARQEEAKRDGITVSEFFASTYLPLAQQDKKPKTVKDEKGLFRLWIAPVIGEKPLKQVAPLDVERVKRRMADAGQSPRSIELALAYCRQIFNAARRAGLWEGDSPTATVKKPKINNARQRYLTRDEAQTLLDALLARSLDTHDAALLSLHSGLRQGEIFALRWSDVDFDRGLLSIRDAKAGDRTAFLTAQAADVLKGRGPGKPSGLVFPGNTGGVVDRVSKTFSRTVEDLKLNEGILDRRQRIVFHSLRHTYASWLVEEGVDLYTVQRLLGHKTGVMTQRYAHHSPEGLRSAVQRLEKAMNAPAPVALAGAGGEEN